LNPRLQALVDRWHSLELTPRQKQLLAWSGYPLFALVVAMLMFLTSVPRERVKDRLEAALSADVSSGQPMAIGMDVTIGDFDLTMLTGLGFKASDIVLRSRPINVAEKPTRYLIDDLRIRLGLFSTLFGKPSYSFKAHALSGEVSGQESGNNDGTKMKFMVDKLVLNDVPSIQQAVGLPIDGTLSGSMDVEVVKNLVANASGTIELDLDDAAIGDGKAKLTVPNDPFLAAGITFPRIKIGKLAGQIIIDKGRARFEGVRVHSADVDGTLDGYVELRDPIGMSQMHAYLKFRPSEALVKREPTIELLNNALGNTGKRSDGYLGIQLTGSLMAMAVLPSKDPPFGVTSAGGSAPSTTPMPTVTPPPSRALPQLAQPPSVAQLPVVQQQPPPPPPPSEPPSNANGGGGSGGGGGTPTGGNGPSPGNGATSGAPPGAGGASSPPGSPPSADNPPLQGPQPGRFRPGFRGGVTTGAPASPPPAAAPAPEEGTAAPPAPAPNGE
jgi:type II secretion system protein N